MKLKTWISRLVLLLFCLPIGIWAVLSQWYGSWPGWICMTLALSFGFAHLCVTFLMPVRYVLPAVLAIFLLALLSFFLMPPSHDRTWQPDVAALPNVEMDDDTVVAYNVRNNAYLSTTQYQARFETRHYQLSKLRSLDVILTDWGLRHVMHTMISFGFEGDRYLCLSIEARKEKGERYSALKGFFRQYELIYILGDERDLVRLRTNYREGEDVYLYRYRVSSPDNLRATFVAFMNRVNQLYDQPEWYNAISENCMTSAFRIARQNAAPGRFSWHWSVVLNGHAPREAYKNETIDTSLPFDKLQRVSLINERARAADTDVNFSQRIRQGLPGMVGSP